MLKLKGLIFSVHRECAQNGSAGENSEGEVHNITLNGDSKDIRKGDELRFVRPMPGETGCLSPTACRMYVTALRDFDLGIALLALYRLPKSRRNAAVPAELLCKPKGVMG